MVKLPIPVGCDFGEYTNDYGRTLCIDIEVKGYRDGVHMLSAGLTVGEVRQWAVEKMKQQLLHNFWRKRGAA